MQHTILVALGNPSVVGKWIGFLEISCGTRKPTTRDMPYFIFKIQICKAIAFIKIQIFYKKNYKLCSSLPYILSHIGEMAFHISFTFEEKVERL